ncbi:NAD-dependent epimerase/dehydratase family protein [bacterium D16-51]|nr:NAD-dependent epimerase/dehydratase family protein [bacterium D16-59]RKI61764.1 NAD-dependent epimerase/dehydratase family protein [bacterium D16-51]
MNEKTILVTGAAGFIGFYLSRRLMEQNPSVTVIGFDSVNDYYDISLKKERLHILEEISKKTNTGTFCFIHGNLADKKLVDSVFGKYQPEIVVNLAAQAGVRYSITNPEAYIESNITGFFNILEACRHSYDNGAGGVKHLVYASSSSVYGGNQKVPYSTEDKTDCPVSLYAATKKSDELLAYSYGKLYQIPMTGLRFFTVYGPLGRPDMAYFGFTNRLVKGETIKIFNYGDMYRDFTYIDDIIEGTAHILGSIPKEDKNGVRHKVYNIGNSSPVSLLNFVDTLENCLLQEGIIAQKGERELLPMQPGDVYQTYADVSELEKDFGFHPKTSLEDGLSRYAKWYKSFYLK